MGNAFCFTCALRSKCKQICKEVRKELRKVTKGKQIWESIVDPYLIEKFKYRSKEKGFRKAPVLYED